MPSQDYPLVLVIWEDHTASAHWMTTSQSSKSQISVCKTIGWLVHKDKRKYVIHNNFIDDDDVSGGESVILRSTILEEYELEVI